jgi:hypothetical protein
LIAAAHRLARHLARIRTGESEPAPEDHQTALRDVISRCIYGVDLNPMAVELCKVSLWMEAIDPGKPLSFLDHHIKCGNSLLGVTPRLLNEGIPEAAYTAIEGDDKAVVKELKARHKKEVKDRTGGRQTYLFEPYLKLGRLADAFLNITTGSNDTAAEIARKATVYAGLISGAEYLNATLLADTWCSAFVWKKDTTDLGQACPTERDFRDCETNPHSLSPHVRHEIARLATEFSFFHWHLAFPEVFRVPAEGQEPQSEQMGWDGGFDVILGNPPWEKLQFEERQFLEGLGVVMDTSRAAERRALLVRDAEEGGRLSELIATAKAVIDRTHAFIGRSALVPLSAKGKFNYYALFTELAERLTHRHGRLGVIVKSGIATDLATRHVFRHFVETQRLIRLVDFENSELLFEEVAPPERFCLLTAGRNDAASLPLFGFNLTNPAQIRDEWRFYSLDAKSFALLNPNTLNCPVFRSRKDAAITTFIYMRSNVLWNHATGDNPFDLRFKQYFNESDDAGLFRRNDELGVAEQELIASPAFTADRTFLPLIEPKYFQLFDHRFGTYGGVPAATRYGRKAPTRSPRTDEKANPLFFQLPRYWIDKLAFDERRDLGWDRGYLFAFRGISNVNTNARTAIGTIVPQYPITKSGPSVLFGDTVTGADVALFVSTFSSFVFDYCCRQKVGGTHLNIFIVEQFPCLPPAVGKTASMWDRSKTVSEWIVPRALELCFTTTDVRGFAADCGYAGQPFRWDNHRRRQIRCELDAALFLLFLGIGPDGGSRDARSDELAFVPRSAVEHIMDTFPIVKRKDVAKYGSYRTKERILAIYDEMAECIANGTEWKSPLDPPPGDPRAAWTEEEMEMWRQGRGDELIDKYGLLDDADDADATDDADDIDADEAEAGEDA